MYSAYKLIKQGDNIQPWCTPFPIWNQSVVPCPILTVASWPAYRFLKRQVRWSGIPISFRIFQFTVIHTVEGFGVVNKAEIDVFLELSYFFDDPVDIGNLISGLIQRFLMSSQISPFLYDSLSSASSMGNFIHKVTQWLQQFKASHPHIMLVQNRKEFVHTRPSNQSPGLCPGWPNMCREPTLHPDTDGDM